MSENACKHVSCSGMVDILRGRMAVHKSTDVTTEDEARVTPLKSHITSVVLVQLVEVVDTTALGSHDEKCRWRGTIEKRTASRPDQCSSP